MSDPLLSLYRRRFGVTPEAVRALPLDGSSRRYFRITSAATGPVVGAVGPNPEENRAFLSFARAMRGAGLPVPEVYADDEPGRCYLMEDLGDTTLFGALTAARGQSSEPFPSAIRSLYEEALALLARVQTEAVRVIDFSAAFPHEEFDEASMRWDIGYFVHFFLRAGGVQFHESRLDRDIARLLDFVLTQPRDAFLYRDFQSRNLMVVEPSATGRLRLIDFQGGRRGLLAYDVASLLYDAKADVPESERERLLDVYLDRISERRPIDRDRFREVFPAVTLLRICQAMGAYGYRGFYQRKLHFLQSVPYAVRNLERIVSDGRLPIRLPEFEAIIGRVSADPRFCGEPAVAPLGRARIKIGSFSYRRGVPIDTGEEGGGFVFDCRGIENPGRDPELRNYTGLEVPVREMLDRVGAEFAADVKRLAEPHIRERLRKGAHYLTFLFGCTGGRHRSVYMAEMLAAFVRQTFPQADVELEHRDLAADLCLREDFAWKA